MPAGAAVRASSRAIAPSWARSSCTPVPSRWAAISSSEARSSSTSRIAPPAPAAATPSSTGRYGVTGMRNSKRCRCPPPSRSVEPPAEELHDPAAERQAQARPLLLHRPAPPCWNDSKISSWSSGAIPIPVSLTDTTSSPGLPSCAQRDGSTGGSELHRVAEQVDDDLLEAELVGLHQADVVGHLHGELDAVASRLARGRPRRRSPGRRARRRLPAPAASGPPRSWTGPRSR